MPETAHHFMERRQIAGPDGKEKIHHRLAAHPLLQLWHSQNQRTQRRDVEAIDGIGEVGAVAKFGEHVEVSKTVTLRKLACERYFYRQTASRG